VERREFPKTLPPAAQNSKKEERGRALGEVITSNLGIWKNPISDTATRMKERERKNTQKKTPSRCFRDLIKKRAGKARRAKIKQILGSASVWGETCGKIARRNAGGEWRKKPVWRERKNGGVVREASSRKQYVSPAKEQSERSESGNRGTMEDFT